MPATLLQDYDCQACGAGITVLHGTSVAAARCLCGRTAWKWIRTRTETEAFVPRIFGRSAALDVHVGRVAPIGRAGVRVDTLRDIRRIERESEAAERNGEGQAVRFRLYSGNDRYTNSFGEVPQEKPKFQRPDGRARLQVRPVDAEVADAADLGPGVTADSQHDSLEGL